MRDLKARRHPDPTALQLTQRGGQIIDAVHEHRLIAGEVAGEQHRGRVAMQAHHGHAGAERLDREFQLTAKPVGEVNHVGRDVPARQVDEVERSEGQMKSLPVST